MRRVPTFLARLYGGSAFWSSVFFTLLLPWVPLGAELGILGEVRSSSLQIFVVLYALGLGASSRGEGKFSLGVVLAIVFSVAYGSILVGESLSSANAATGGFNSGFWYWLSLFIGVVLFIIYAVERYDKHVKDGKPFLEF